MRGIATVIIVGFTSIAMFGIFAPAVLEPLAETVLQNQAVQSSPVDANAFVNGLLRTVLMWGPIITIGAAVASAVVYYLRRERVGRRV
jgi:thiol:disulfide interchange protein